MQMRERTPSGTTCNSCTPADSCTPAKYIENNSNFGSALPLHHACDTEASLAMLHNRVASELRPIASAVFLLAVNFIGLGVGPLMIGAMSQYGFAGFGTGALRYSLVVSQFVAIWAAFHYYIAGSRLRQEVEQTAPAPQH